MTAEQLSIDLDTGLEHDSRYQPAIAAVHRLVMQSGVQLSDLLTCLNAGLPGTTPLPLQVLVVEAVARQLGRDWTDDASSFVDVTIASTRLQDMAQALAIDAAIRNNLSEAPFAAILMPRGEQHTLMSYLTGALFQTFGWQHQVLTHDHASQPDFADAVARSDAICIGWCNMRLEREVGELIEDLKLLNPNKNPPLIAGGIAALDSVDFLVEMGIDCVTDSAYSAVKIADSFNILEKMKPIAPSAEIIADDRITRTAWRTS